MEPLFQLSGARIAMTIAAVLIEIGLPLALGFVARRRLGVSWRYFGYGALIFVLFQLLSLWAIWALRDQPDTEPELLAAAT